MKHEDMSRATQLALAESLKKLMKGKSLRRITIAELVADCGLNRNTFYYHFEDIYALLRWMLEQEAYDIFRQFDLEGDHERAFTFVADYVMQGLAETMDNKTFIEGMNERLSGGVLHATRRSFELAMAAEMLDDAGLDSSVSTAAAQKLRKLGEMNLKEKLGDYRPTDWKDALRCIHENRD